MMRKMLKTVLAVVLAAFSVVSVAEAAPRRVVHRRVRHSARVVHHAVKKPVKRVVRHAARPAKRVAPRRSTKPR